MLDRIAAWQQSEKVRAIVMEAMNQLISGNRARDIIPPPENRDVPDSLASEILNGPRSGQACVEDLQHGSRRPRTAS